MACALTQGYSLANCSDGTGGIKNAFFIEKDNIDTITKVAGVITVLENAVGKQFRKYELQRATADFTEEGDKIPENGTVGYKQNLKIILNSNQTATRNELLLLAKNPLYIVVEDRNGKFWLMGETGYADLIKGSRKWGVQGTDRSGFELEFVAEEPEYAAEVTALVAAALETPGV